MSLQKKKGNQYLAHNPDVRDAIHRHDPRLIAETTRTTGDTVEVWWNFERPREFTSARRFLGTFSAVEFSDKEVTAKALVKSVYGLVTPYLHARVCPMLVIGSAFNLGNRSDCRVYVIDPENDYIALLGLDDVIGQQASSKWRR
jgi:hypothetical protein